MTDPKPFDTAMAEAEHARRTAETRVVVESAVRNVLSEFALKNAVGRDKSPRDEALFALLRYGAVAVVAASVTVMAMRAHFEHPTTVVTPPVIARCPPAPQCPPVGQCTPCPDFMTPPPPPEVPTWSVNALSHRGANGQTFTYRCDPEGEAGHVWGTDTYTDDSSVCTAAVHAGRISFASGGTVTIEITAGRPRYAGSNRHGVTSVDFAVWPGSYVFR